MERNCKNCKNQDCFWVGMDDDDICDEYLPKTNADRIRSMTDEELAVFLGSIIQSTKVGYAAIADKTNEKNAVLIYGWLEWLKRECEEADANS